MRTIRVTISFHGQVEELLVKVSDGEWADPHFRTRLKNRLECSPSVLKMEEHEAGGGNS